MEKKKKRKPRANGACTSPETIASREKAARALELRKEGMSFPDIAREVGYKDRRRAHEAVTEAISRITREAAAEVRTLELERLDAMWTIPYLNAQRGDVDAINACMRIMDRRAKLLGIDAPAKVDATVQTKGGVLLVPSAVTPEEWAAAAADQQERLLRNEATPGADGD